MTDKELYPELDFLGLGAVRKFVPNQRLLDRYVLQRVLGWGGMGVTWLAFDEESQKEVVLKFLPEIVRQDEASFEGVKEETRCAVGLVHPHIVRVHDFFGDYTYAAIAMEQVNGHSVSTWRQSQRKGVFEVPQIRAWAVHLLDALDYAHIEAKILHRDLKPDHLFVTEADELKVGGFGTARAISDSVCRLSGRGVTSDMVVYMSPQLAMGGPPSAQDDIYAFGATFYELLTGQPPFLGRGGDMLAQMWQVVPPSLAQRRHELGTEGKRIPAEWEETIAACLAKDPAQRPRSIAEVAERLGFAVAPIPVAETGPAPEPAVELPPPELLPPPVELSPPEATLPPPVELPPPQAPPPPAATELPPAKSFPTRPKKGPLPKSPSKSVTEPATPPATPLPVAEPPSPQTTLAKPASKNRWIIVSLVVLFAVDGLAIAYFMFVPKDEAARQAQLTRLEADTKAATDTAEKLKADEAAAQAARDEEKAVLEKAKQDADARAAAAEQSAQQARADADKAKQSEQAALQRTAAVIGPVAGKPWTNSLGVKFVPAGTDGVLFSVWDVRVKDYAAFVAATGRDWPKTTFAQTEMEPAVKVSWDDAHAFCDWLTKKEQGEGRLTPNQVYRLPTDAEWSKAVGLTENSWATPKENDGDVKDVYPWGNQWPPPTGAGNYAESLTGDGFAKTSPVGSFKANPFGLYDMGGNVWQWCEDKYDYAHDYRALRGASWVDRNTDSLLSSSRSGNAPGGRDENSGFRVVLVVPPQ